MIRLDHVSVDVGSLALTRDWYTSVIGLVVEFETTDPPVVGLTDDAGITLILAEHDGDVTNCRLFFQVDDLLSTHRELVAGGTEFLYGPQPNDWGFGAGLVDPDGRLVGLWDEKSMRANHSPGD
jgi:catechol 2,3-dioxygenase-like lactoylglutathione lyase family enzyme